jgi:hypothetical protein
MVRLFLPPRWLPEPETQEQIALFPYLRYFLGDIIIVLTYCIAEEVSGHEKYKMLDEPSG